MMTNTQQEIAKVIHFMLNSAFFRAHYSTPGLYDILNQAVRKFPEITAKQENTWKNVDLYRKHFKISKRAAQLIDMNQGKKDLWKLLQYEHIEPVSITIKHLIDLGERPTLEQIESVLKNCEIIILSKEEAHVLDGSAQKLYPLDGVEVRGKGMRASGSKAERLNAIGVEFDERFYNNTL